ncbi:hypothetical protein BKM15_26205 [Pseudomonas syringae pv. syringae]|nr:hypothetical protein BKM15_26205 [Pseudomonas syringae pv. syringae]
MRPTIFKGEMSPLPGKRQKAICKCAERCEHLIIIVGQEDFVICEKAARDHALDILNQLNVITEIVTQPTPFWTTKEERYVINYFEQHGNHNGAYRIIGAQLGRSRDAVKNKVLKLRKEGRIAC